MPNRVRTAARSPSTSMLAEVRVGLARAQKELPPKFFYDERGSRLFERITELPEYYPTRIERRLLQRLMPRWLGELRPAGLLELGSGNAEKSRIILDAMREAGTLATYVPVDVSGAFLEKAALRLREEYPGLRVVPAVADISVPFAVPPALGRPALFAFLGSTIGNFEDGAAVALLRRMAVAMLPGDRFLMGADLVKDLRPLEAAYNDSQGVTAEFNLNVLEVLNRTLGADFDPEAFLHRAFFNPNESRIEMHLVSARTQEVAIPGAGIFLFRPGESIRTEISRKFDRPMLERLFDAAGMRIDRWETDADGWYALMTAVPCEADPPMRRRRVARGGQLVAALREDLRKNAFCLQPAGARRERLGAEIEFITLRDDGSPSPIESTPASPGSLDFLLGYGSPLGWELERSAKGTPRLRVPGRGTLSFEPGGQIEFSTLPTSSVRELLGHLQAVVPPLVRAAGNAGIRMLGVGIDPVNPAEEAPLFLPADRYTRMARYFASIGPAGAVMMRQTAAYHVNLDFGEQNMLRWRVLNAASPCLTAMFANSPIHGGVRTGCCSSRARAWRELDPARTGILDAGPVSEDEYLDFALGAPAMLLDAPVGYLPFGEHWVAETASLEHWHEHLTTLFPEIRPRGYLEIRCIDALPPEWYAVPLVVLAGLVCDTESLQASSDLLGSPNTSHLARAAVAGLADPDLGALARDLFQIGLRGCRRLGPAMVAPADLEIAEEYYRVFTSRSRSPADAPTS